MSVSEDSQQQQRLCIRARQQAFLDDKPMSDTAAACAWKDFRRPLLGRFTHRGSFKFMKLLGFGIDGVVWKVRIDSKTYALKVDRTSSKGMLWVDVDKRQGALGLASTTKPPQLKINGREVRNMRSTEDYRAVVYEYVPSSDVGMDAEIVQAQLDFFWLGGWCMVPMRIENWGGAGILLDMADAVCLCHMGWRKEYYRRTEATEVMELLES
ncbi:hypothetical protein E4U24_007564 [Claviceps purpurea]|nr:hypothetical protein E4U24_007564 [Claviceps purpurea]